jgi:two-component system sensor histidine kinase KdpD
MVAMQVSDEWATVSVADTGPGLSEADSQRIWRRFSRGSAASASTPGIGLGLSLVRAVASVHHGEADGRNRPEGGAEFWIRLPLAKA